MIGKLASLLRAMLRDHDTLVPLREELQWIDDYLEIETVRFGAEKLRVVKEIEPSVLDIRVPSILLQPLVENSIKHGLEPRIAGGTVTLRSRRGENGLVIEVEDDGVGISEQTLTSGTGIGIKLVRDRLQMLYGNMARFDLESRPGRGTRVCLTVPVEDAASDHPMSER